MSSETENPLGPPPWLNAPPVGAYPGEDPQRTRARKIAQEVTDKRPEPSYKVKSAVSDVFDDGDVATDAEILYFYAPELCQSLWHESQTYVCTIGGHRFFEEAAK